MHVIPPSISEADERENQDVEAIMMMMGQGDPEVVRRVLRKCNGDVEIAANAVLSGETGDSKWTSSVEEERKHAPTRSHSPRHGRAGQPSPVIDLTVEGNDLSRALQASLETNVESKFGPSERPPDPNWAMVPSNVATTSGMSQDDESLHQAIVASLNQSIDPTEVYEEPTLEDRLRIDDRPVTIRPRSPSLSYASLLIHGLFFVPQIRERVARWRPQADVVPVEMQGAERTVWTLHELFVDMDLMVLNEINCDESIKPFDAPHWSHASERPGDLSFAFLQKLASTIDPLLNDEDTRLFQFRYGHRDSPPQYVSQEAFIVKVSVDGVDNTNDLISLLSAQLSQHIQNVIFEPSEVVAFQLTPSSNLPSYSASTGSKSEQKPFQYPKHIYLDQFLNQNAELACKKHIQKREMNERVHELTQRKMALTHFNDKDTLQDLRSSIYYYEHVADAKGDLERKSTLETIALKLKSTLVRIENELKVIDDQVAKLNEEVIGLFDSPELQHLRYDLRVVLLHDGLFGRKHIYSYVQGKDVWWKTADTEVTKVSEDTVLTDPAGLHLGAGPYLLLYSRAITPEEEARYNDQLPWINGLKERTKYNNRLMLNMIPPEKAALAASMFASAPAETEDVELHSQAAPSIDEQDTDVNLEIQ